MIEPGILTDWTIVVIDDEDDSLNIASYLLGYYGADIHTAQNGKEGLQLIRTLHPKFVISDLSMPEMDGWGLMQELRADPSINKIPVIALTAHAMLGDREKALSAGFHSYLTKPLSPVTFMEDLVRILFEIPGFAAELKPV